MRMTATAGAALANGDRGEKPEGGKWVVALGQVNGGDTTTFACVLTLMNRSLLIWRSCAGDIRPAVTWNWSAAQCRVGKGEGGGTR